MDVFVNLEAQAGATYHDQLRIALIAERNGIGGVFRADHVRGFGALQPPGPSDAWTVLAGLARDTTTVRLGTLMTCAPLRLPAMLAMTTAGVDRMSGGRLELGIGAGWFESEHRSAGARLNSPAERLQQLHEYLEIVTGLWRCPPGETFTHHGRFYHVEDNPGLPKPAQTPRPPIIVGGNGRRQTPALAARFADEYNLPRATPARAQAHVTRAQQACQAAGRDPATLRISVTLQLCCGSSVMQADARARRYGWDGDQDTVTGTPGDLLQHLAVYADAGISRVYAHITDFRDEEHIALLGAAVAVPAIGLGNGQPVPIASTVEGPAFAVRSAGRLQPGDLIRLPWSPRTFVRVTTTPKRTATARVRTEATNDLGELYVLDLDDWHPLHLD
ncbi:LLM class flavin-dependent oxidoreductase [Actinoplanes sp. NPDC048988]|uniref:LLM class flavin-dependent oxidoreductase n=1 Tax=Actinoplanes sp. NPDC048988 TaxID=3363901 RepID=UPI003721994F